MFRTGFALGAEGQPSHVVLRGSALVPNIPRVVGKLIAVSHRPPCIYPAREAAFACIPSEIQILFHYRHTSILAI